MVYGINSACFFVFSCENLTVAVDHKPLLKVFQDRALEDIDNSHLRNLKEKTLRYRFCILHVPGVKQKAADATSRHPVTREPTRMLLSDDIPFTTDTTIMPTPSECHQALLTTIRTTESMSVTAIETSLHHYMTAAVKSLKSVTWDRVWLATNSDEDMTTLLSLIESGIPEFRHQLSPWLQEYNQFREHLSSIDGVITYKDRVLIPPFSEKGCLTCPSFSTRWHHLNDLPR